MIGQKVREYLILGIIGEGSQGRTYICIREGERYCLKEFEFRGSEVSVFKKFDLFERESKVLGGLSIEGVPKCIEYFSEGGKFYLVQELVSGKDLRRYRECGGIFSLGMYEKYIQDMGKILLELGRLGVTHRDINPRNVIWDGERFWLVDFGGVKVGRGEGSTVVGTYGYMGSEVFRGRVERSTDWYGMGMTMVWMLSGREPEDIGYREDGELDIGSVNLGKYRDRIWGWVRSDWKRRVWDLGEFGKSGGGHISKRSSPSGMVRVKKFHLYRMILWLILFGSICMFSLFSYMICAFGITIYIICLPGIARNICDGGLKESGDELKDSGNIRILEEQGFKRGDVDSLVLEQIHITNLKEMK